MPTYDGGNVFAKILRGEMPAHRVYEDEDTLAILDVMPQADGHTLVLSRRPARNLLDADPDMVAALFRAVRRVSIAARAAFAADGISVFQNNEPAAEQTVFHLHVHVVPRHAGRPLRPAGGRMADPAVLAAHAEKLRAALAEA